VVLFKIACSGWPLASSAQMTTPVADEKYEVARQGLALGTYPLSEISGLIDAGKLHWSDDCWTEGMEFWRKLDEIRDQITAAAPAPATADVETYLMPVGVALGLTIAVGLGYALLRGGDLGREADRDFPAGVAPRALSVREKSLHLTLSELQDRITALAASHFLTRKDTATGNITYLHRFYDNVGNRIVLRVFVSADGQSHLYTYHRGANWLLHRQLRFIIDRQVIETERLPAHRCIREIKEDNIVTESCHFTGEDDRKIITRLAASHSSAVRLQLIGPNVSEIPLSFETKQAIKDAQELSELLASRHRLLGTLSPAP
jgi:hypothetical protein